MKRFALFLGIAVALVASCSTQEKDFQIPAQDDTLFYASFEQPGEDGTKVYANEDLLLRWTADDRVSIFNKLTYNQQYKFTGETGDNAGGFRKVDTDEFVTGNAISHVVSVYPFQEATKITESEVLTVSLPAKQTYAQNTFGLGANTMVSVSSDNVIQYKNIGGYLVFKLYGEGVFVSSITLRGNNGEKLAGKASVTMPLDGTPTTVMTNDATTEISLKCEVPVVLGATAEESTLFWFVIPPVTFSKGFTITVNQSTGGASEKSTAKSITIERNKLTKMSTMEVEAISIPPILEAVDLGLPSGLKWSSFNLGATKPEEYGDYFAWGETEPYYSSQDPLTWKTGKEAGYNWTSYKWGWETGLTKYCSDSRYGYNGFTDTKTILDLEDDAANVNLGDYWRMPTITEWVEIKENCTWTRTTQNGVNGYLVTASNGNSIFLPATGHLGYTSFSSEGSYGPYWSSSLYTGNLAHPNHAWYTYFNSEEVNYSLNFRYYGYPIRPVYAESNLIPVASVSLNKTEQDLVVGKTAALVATVLPENATNKTVTWSSSNTAVATVSSSGVLTGVGVGTVTITATTTDGGKTATCTVTVSEPYTVATPEAVDLGLSVKWASFNLGALTPEEYGVYFAWGETEPKTKYSLTNYKWCMGSSNMMTKYCSNSEYGYNGFTDTKTVLDPEDDAAKVNLGDCWRMATDAEWTELRENCTWTWTTQNGVNGYLVTASNGNSIFIPAAGDWFGTILSDVGSFGNYLSSSLNTSSPDGVWIVYFNSVKVYRKDISRFYGYSVRPVYAD